MKNSSKKQSAIERDAAHLRRLYQQIGMYVVSFATGHPPPIEMEQPPLRLVVRAKRLEESMDRRLSAMAKVDIEVFKNQFFKGREN